MLVSRIKELCNKKGVSFAQFERESGVGVNSAGRWDVNSPSLKKGNSSRSPLLLILLLCKKYPSLTGISERDIMS